MTVHVCPRCHYETCRKPDLRRHLTRKRKCKKLFSTKSIKECLLDLDKSPIEILREENERLKTQFNINHNINHNSGNVHIGDNNITINAYNQTSIKKIETELRNMKSVKDDVDMIIKYIRLVHFNKDLPENHNTYIENANLKRLLRFDGEQFTENGRGNSAIDSYIKDDVGKQIEELDLGESELYSSHARLFHLMDNPPVQDEGESQQSFKDRRQNHENTIHKLRNKVMSLMYGKRGMIKETLKKSSLT